MFDFFKRGPSKPPESTAPEPELTLEDFAGETTTTDETEIQKIFANAGLSVSAGDLIKLTDKKDPSNAKQRQAVRFCHAPTHDNKTSPYNIVLTNGMRLTFFNFDDLNKYTFEVIKDAK